MHYVTSDIHNDNQKLQELLKVLNLKDDDKLFLLGDLFDRSNHNPDPVGVYFAILALEDKCQVIRGNHEQELAEYIASYYQTPEKKRIKLEPYPYNTFELLKAFNPSRYTEDGRMDIKTSATNRNSSR